MRTGVIPVNILFEKSTKNREKPKNFKIICHLPFSRKKLQKGLILVFLIKFGVFMLYTAVFCGNDNNTRFVSMYYVVFCCCRINSII